MVKILTTIITVSMMCVVGIIPHASSCEQSSFLATQPTGTVRGMVMDFNEAVIPNATVIFDGGPTKQMVTSDESGKYEITLPAGIYRIRTEATEDFLPFRRAAFQVRPNISIMINVTLATSPFPISILQVGTPSEIPRASKLRLPKYDSFSLQHSSGVPLQLVVQFNKKQGNKGIIKYSRAMVSYDALTIYADEVRLDPKTFRLEAEGNVVVEDGKQRTHAKSVAVEFRAGEPIIKLTK